MFKTKIFKFVFILHVCCLVFFSTKVVASPTLQKTFDALLPSNLGVKSAKLDSQGSLLVMGTSTTGFCKFSPDGSSVSSVSYNVAFPSPVGVDFVVSGTSLYIATSAGSNGQLACYDMSGNTATFVGGVKKTGSGAIAKGIDNKIYSNRSAGLACFNSNLVQISPTVSMAQAIAKMFISQSGVLYYMSTSGAFRRSTDYSSSTDTALLTGFGTSADLNSLEVMNDDTLYVSYKNSLRKYYFPNGESPTLLWTLSLSTQCGMTVGPSGQIYIVTTDGVARLYSQINRVASFGAEFWDDVIRLSWVTGVSDNDFSGVTIRRSTSGYPATPTEGVLVTSNCKTTSFSDSDLEPGTTYYYTIFNQTVDGFYSAGVTKSMNTAPVPPVLTASKSTINGTSISLSWTAPPGTNSFILEENDAAISTYIDLETTSWTRSNLSDGDYRYAVYAVGAHDAMSMAATSNVITIDSTPPSAPSLVATKRSTDGTTVDLSWNRPEGTAFFILKQNGIMVSRNISVNTLSISRTGLSDGEYVYTLYAVDAYQNTSNVGTSEPLIIDTTPPEKATVFGGTARDTAALLHWTVADPSTTVTIRCAKHGYPTGIFQGTLVVANSTESSYRLQNLEEGVYYFSLFVNDSFGNVSAPATASVVIDGKPTLEKLKSQSQIKKGRLEITQNVTTAVVHQEIGKEACTATLDIQAIYKSDGTTLGVGAGAIGFIRIATANAVWHEQGTVKIGQEGGQGVVEHSAGRVQILGSLDVGVGVSNSGQYVLSGGTLKTSRLRIGSESGTGAFVWTGGTLETQHIQGDLSNNGGTLILNSDAPITITGNYQQLNGGRLSLALKPTTLHSTLPLLNATEGISLAGTIQVSLDGYDPKPGDKIHLVDPAHVFVRLTGVSVFEAIDFDLPALEPRLAWDTSHFHDEGYIGVMSSGTSLLESRPLNYPNPFKLSTGTEIGYWLNADADIELRVYTSTGKEVYKERFMSGLSEGAKNGYNKVTINRSVVGEDLPSGVYPYVLIHEGKVIGTGRMVVRP